MPTHRRIVAVVAALLSLGLAVPVQAASVSTGRTVTIEQRTLDWINAGRNNRGLRSLGTHAGLREVARDHAREMAARRTLGHWGFEQRLQDAVPDPFESNGPSDDGIWGVSVAACENGAYRYAAGTSGSSDEQIAKGLYLQWRNSAPHAACLFDSGGHGHNVAGLGIYIDSGGVVWATVDIARDSSPPGSTGLRCSTETATAWVSVCPST